MITIKINHLQGYFLQSQPDKTKKVKYTNNNDFRRPHHTISSMTNEMKEIIHRLTNGRSNIKHLSQRTTFEVDQQSG